MYFIVINTVNFKTLVFGKIQKYLFTVQTSQNLQKKQKKENYKTI